MAVYKRGGVWWYEFVYAEKRIRESAKTSRKTVAVEELFGAGSIASLEPIPTQADNHISSTAH